MQDWGYHRRRIVTALLLVGAILPLIILGGRQFTLLLAAALIMMAVEWLDLLTKTPRVIDYIGLLGLSHASLAALHVLGATAALEILLLGGTAAALLALARGFALILGGYAYLCLPVFALYWVRQGGLDFTLWLIGSVCAVDIAAFFVGRAIGGAKIWPAVSPNKTWAGLGGGVLGALGIAVLADNFSAPAPDLARLLLLAPLIALIAQGGDFFESWLKRRRGVSDSGGFLPGHGGVLDRVDGLIGVSALIMLASLASGIAPRALLWGV